MTEAETPIPEPLPRRIMAEVVLALRVSIGVFMRLGKRNVGLISAGVAFFSILAVFPGLAAVIALFGFMADPVVITEQMDLLREFTPDQAYNLLNAQVTALLATNQSTLGWASIVSTGAALWSARAGVSALQRGLNAIYGADNRGGLWQVLSALGLTVALVAVVLVALLAVIVVPILLALVPLGPLAGPLLAVVPWIVALGILVLGLTLIYRYGPNHGAGGPPHRVVPGVVLAVVVWAAASIGFSYYLQNFGSYNEVYGSIGAVIALLMWFYIGAFVVLLGACLNAEMDQRAARDT
ncbi:membrane protein [Rhodobacteraceae bacterium MBR-64]